MNQRFRFILVLTTVFSLRALTQEPAGAPEPQAENFQTVTAVLRLETFGGGVPLAPAQTPVQSGWSLTSRGQHHQTWSATVTSRDARTGRAVTRTKEIVEVGSGINYRDSEGRFQPTREQFDVTPEGFAVARFGPHLLIVGNNINSPTAVDFLTSDGVRLRSGPLAIGFYDPVTGANHVLATIRDTPAELTAPNQVTFRSAFDGLDASIRITYRRAGMSSDLILHEAPPDPQALGFSEKSRLELYTEFVPETPQPVQTARVLRGESDPRLRQAMVEPDFTDHFVDFGAYKMPSGFAFELPDPNVESKIPVAKRYADFGGRTVLVEAIEWSAAKRMLAALPPAKGGFDLLAPPKALLAAARPPGGPDGTIRDLPCGGSPRVQPNRFRKPAPTFHPLRSGAVF